MNDTISRQAAIDEIREDADWLESQGSNWQTERKERDFQILTGLPSAPPSFSRDQENDRSVEPCGERLISLQAAIDALGKDVMGGLNYERILNSLSSVTPKAEPHWIPCSERLPEKGKEVLVCYDFKGHRSVLIGTLYGDGKFHGYDDEYLTPEGRKYRKAVAWMPLPKAYREDVE